jgi:hypothetical protein
MQQHQCVYVLCDYLCVCMFVFMCVSVCACTCVCDIMCACACPFHFCGQQETEGGSTSTVVHLLPHGGKSLGFSSDGSASGNGYGSGAPKYVPSQELLEREFSCKTRL